MTFADLPDEVLDEVLGEGWDSSWTLRSELTAVGEDLDYVEFTLSDTKSLNHLVGWTKSYVVFLTWGGFGDRAIVSVPRNPPKKSR